MSPTLRQLIWVGRLEGLSLLILVGIAMPLKYIAGEPLAVRVVGMAHGILFLLFCLALFRAMTDEKWPARRAALGFVASFLPFGTFWFERRLRDGSRAP